MATMGLIMVKVKYSGHSTYWPTDMIPTEPDEEKLVAALHQYARERLTLDQRILRLSSELNYQIR
jgi:hypothetical protein